MARPMSPKRLAQKITEWAAAGFDYSIVLGAQAAMSQDLRESIARAPRKTGRLSETVRLSNPTLRRTAKLGRFRIALVAGNRREVKYASVLQRGVIGYAGAPATAKHQIGSSEAGVFSGRLGVGGRNGRAFKVGSGKVLRFTVGGAVKFARRVTHPGSHFKAREYLRVDQSRAVREIDQAISRSAAAL